MGSKVLQAKFDQNLAKMFKKQPLYKKGSVRPHRGTKPIFLYKKSFCTGLKGTHFVEGIGRGILNSYQVFLYIHALCTCSAASKNSCTIHGRYIDTVSHSEKRLHNGKFCRSCDEGAWTAAECNSRVTASRGLVPTPTKSSF